jgi:hypothetical protein
MEPADLEKTVAIRIITNLIDKYNLRGFATPEQILSAINLFISYSRFIPDDLRKKAAKIFRDIIIFGKVTLSTDKKKAEKLANASIPDPRVKEFCNTLGYVDVSTIILSFDIKKLWELGLDSDAGHKKGELCGKYHERGERICFMITTGDIAIILNDIDLIEEKDKIKRFEWWITNYFKIFIPLSPSHLSSHQELIKTIIRHAKETPIEYIILHLLSPNPAHRNELLELIKKIKDNKILTYHGLEYVPFESGANYGITIKIITTRIVTK